MTKHDIIKAAAKAAGVTQETAAAVITAALEAATCALVSNEPVKVDGWGTFEAKPRKAGTVYNFATGETMHRPASKAVTFKAAAKIKQMINAADTE